MPSVNTSNNDIVFNLLGNADDLLSSLDGVRSALTNLDGISQTVAADAFFGGLASGAFSTALDTVRNGIDGLVGSLREAAHTEVDILASASIIGTNLGIPLQQAQTMVKGLRQEIAEAAGALPGATDDYNVILEKIGGTLATVAHGDASAFKALAEDIDKRAGVLGAIAGVSGQATGDSINRLLAGTSSFGELQHMALGEKNPAFLAALRQQAAQLGASIEQWNLLQPEIRAKVVQAALQVATPDTMINAMQDTLQSSIETVKTRLFDPTVGAFGVMRTVADTGGRSVLDAAKATFNAFSETFGAIQKILSASGLTFDPLKPVVAFLDLLSDVAAKVASVFRGGDLTELGTAVSDGLNSLVTGFGMWVDQLSPEQLSNGMAGIINNIVEFLGKATSHVDWPNLGVSIGKLIANIGVALVLLPFKVDWVNLAKVAATGVMNGVATFLGLFAGGLIVEYQNIGAIWKTWAQAAEQAVEAVSDVWHLLTDPVVALFKTIAAKVQEALDFVNNTVVKPVASAVQSVTGAVGAVADATGTVTNVLTNPFGAGMDMADKLLHGVFVAPQKGSEGQPASVPFSVPFQMPQTGVAPLDILKQVFDGGKPLPASAPQKHAMLPIGDVQDGVKPLQTAMLPMGDELAAGTRGLPQVNVGSASTTNTTSHATFAPVVNVDAKGISSPQEVADLTMRRIESAFQEYLQNRLV